jgi:hypothetical protein
MSHTNLHLHAALKNKHKVKFELQIDLKIQFVPHSKHIPSRLTTYSEYYTWKKIAVYSEILTKQTHAVSRTQNFYMLHLVIPKALRVTVPGTRNVHPVLGYEGPERE